jgi:hypothetical protein
VFVRLGGRAMPAAWKTLPTWPATAVRVVMRVPSSSMVASYRRLRSRSRSTHSMTRPRLWHRSDSAFCSIRARNEQNTWPLAATLPYCSTPRAESSFAI